MNSGIAVIEVEGLRKEYRRRRGGRVRAIDELQLSVPAGGVFGFLGPNGSGKTTTIRCLLGLARPTAGSCHLLGVPVRNGLPDVIVGNKKGTFVHIHSEKKVSKEEWEKAQPKVKP